MDEVLQAQKRIAPYITRTPLHHYRSLDEIIGAEVYVKHENHQSLGAFKLRGALNTVSQLTEDEKTKGIISSSTGNFGQGVAYAGGIFGVKVVVVVPKTTNPDKIASMKRLGAELILYGSEFDEAREYAEKLSKEKGYFDSQYKQSLPYLPNKIGVITSPTGSVIHDIINRIKARFPINIDLWPAPVQGSESAALIINLAILLSRSLFLEFTIAAAFFITPID